MILLLGHSGFLGSTIASKLANNGFDFIGLSLSAGFDLRDWDATQRCFEKYKPDIVINCAAHVGGIQYGLKNQADMFCDNMLMTINLFRACSMFDVKRLVNPISNCAYPGKQSYFKEENFWEGSLHESVLGYGFARKAVCVASTVYCNQYNLDTINLVLPNLYGPGDHFEPERSHALGGLINKIAYAHYHEIGEVLIWGSGSPIREWMFIEDAAEAMIKATSIAPFGDIINVGVGSGVTIRETADLIAKAVGYKGNFVYDLSKPDGAPIKTMEGNRGRQLLNWEPSVDFLNGVLRTVEWYIKDKEL